MWGGMGFILQHRKVCYSKDMTAQLEKRWKYLSDWPTAVVSSKPGKKRSMTYFHNLLASLNVLLPSPLGTKAIGRRTQFVRAPVRKTVKPKRSSEKNTTHLITCYFRDILLSLFQEAKPPIKSQVPARWDRAPHKTWSLTALQAWGLKCHPATLGPPSHT